MSILLPVCKLVLLVQNSRMIPIFFLFSSLFKFCDNCHQSGVWQTLAVYQTGANAKKVWEYKQCDGLQSQIQATMAKHRGASDDDMNKHLEKLLANPVSLVILSFISKKI
jgi:hypothetical protein